MNMAMRLRLERTIDYHQSMATHHSTLHDEWLKGHKREAQRAVVEEVKDELREEGSRRKPPAPTSIPEEELRSPHTPIVELHAEVVRQLREVLDAVPLRPAITAERELQAESGMPRREQPVSRPVSRPINRQSGPVVRF